MELFTKIVNSSYLLIISAALTKMRNDLKPPETTQKLPETNHPKPATLQYFLLKISYSQVAFVLILHPKVFFGQSWSQNLKFSISTEICNRFTLVYAYYNLMFILFKFLSVIFFGANLVLYSEGVHCCMLIIILMFIFSKLLSVIFLDKFGPKV